MGDLVKSMTKNYDSNLAELAEGDLLIRLAQLQQQLRQLQEKKSEEGKLHIINKFLQISSSYADGASIKFDENGQRIVRKNIPSPLRKQIIMGSLIPPTHQLNNLSTDESFSPSEDFPVPPRGFMQESMAIKPFAEKNNGFIPTAGD